LIVFLFVVVKKPARHLKRRVFLSTVNSIIAGMVAVAGGAVAYNPWSAVVIGFIAALSFLLWSKLLIKLHVDDPVETAAGKISKNTSFFSPIIRVNSSYWWRFMGYFCCTNLSTNNWTKC
jgi:hypothetical protein